MRQIKTDILVIGGGATGTGILRDLAMRGFKCLLVERRDLAYGTTGRYHGLLHSGGRYAVKDPSAARECIAENKILRQIMPQCIEDTGGFFVLTPFDDPDYIPIFLKGCQNSGIPVEQLSINQMLKEEPLLSPNIQLCYRLPDASADSFLAVEMNATSSLQHGAQVLPYHEVINISTIKSTMVSHQMVTGALCRDLIRDEDVQIEASMVVNASGAWAGKIAKMAGISLQMAPGKGSMVAFNHRLVNTIINRCKYPADGDILVPAHTVSVIGTTDIRVLDPDSYSIEPWEIRMLLDEGEKIIPHIKQFRVLRAWAGVRPLIQDKASNHNRDISRAFTLLDHSELDGVDGFVTITSGKWTTYRKMAEATVDKVCEKLKVNRQCRTHLEMLPMKKDIEMRGHFLGARLQKIEKEFTYGQLICECELATINDVRQAIILSDAKTLDDIRRNVRLGMGPCQGAFCTIRVAGMLHDLRHPSIEDTNASIIDFLEERWKGNQPTLWGQQLRQERLNELIYINNLNVNHLPIHAESKFFTEKYAEASSEEITTQVPDNQHINHPPIQGDAPVVDVVVIGAGISGLIAAWRAGASGQKTKILTKGWGTPYWSTGCIDVLGYMPPDFLRRVESPASEIDKLTKMNPNHPYAIIGFNVLEKAINDFMRFSAEYGCPYTGSLETNLLLPTALGAVRPTCLVPRTMIAGDLRKSSPILIVGFNQFLDFYPTLIADNLNAHGFLASSISLDLLTLRNRKYVSGMVLARLFDDPDFRDELIKSLKPKIGNISQIGFPAVLGLNNTLDVLDQLESALGIPVFEIPGLPPSVPGIRLHNMLLSAIEKQGGIVNNGILVSGAQVKEQYIDSVISEAAARQLRHPARKYILASGGILGGGIITDSNGYAQEPIFKLQLAPSLSRSDWFKSRFLSHESHPIHTMGLQVNPALQPVNDKHQVSYHNLFAVGNIIGNCDPIREFSLEGIALATGFKIGESINL